MTDLEKFQLVNSCETVKELKDAIIKLSNTEGYIQGRTRIFDGIRMSNNVASVVNKTLDPRVLTREFGIRQQALYLSYYE